MNDTRDVLGAKMSTGMKQKVSVARAVVHDPPVLIFDEATAGLDVLVARALLNTVAELRDHGKCIVFSTHIMREAEKLCDRDRHPAPRAASWPKGRWRKSATGTARTTLKNCSSN